MATVDVVKDTVVQEVGGFTNIAKKTDATLTMEPVTNSVWKFSPADYNGTPIEMGISENAGVYSLTPTVGG